MRILLVNKFHWNKGGSEKYYFELGELLKKHGHEVAYFSMQDEKNVKTGDKEYFVPSFDLNKSSKLKALSVIYNKKNAKLMEKALDDFKPDIVHLNNFQRQLSASIIKPCKKKNIPVVFTAHDLQAICPAITMMDMNKKTCELCLRGKYLNCVKKSCNKGSKLKSIIGALEAYYYRMSKIYIDKIDAIITPTEFYKKMLIKDGISPQKIFKIHNFLYLSDYSIKNEKRNNTVLYIGRLSSEKGINNLIEAFNKIDNYSLYIIGDGPEKDNIINNIKNKTNIKLIGFVSPSEVRDYISKSLLVVVPSTWYENGSYVAMESLAMGRCVLGANIGGIPEIVVDKKNGLLFKHDDVNDLSQKINQLLCNEEDIRKYEQNGRKYIEEQFSSEFHYDNIISLYEKLVKKGEK